MCPRLCPVPLQRSSALTTQEVEVEIPTPCHQPRVCVGQAGRWQRGCPLGASAFLPRLPGRLSRGVCGAALVLAKGYC